MVFYKPQKYQSPVRQDVEILQSKIMMANDEVIHAYMDKESDSMTVHIQTRLVMKKLPSS